MIEGSFSKEIKCPMRSFFGVFGKVSLGKGPADSFGNPPKYKSFPLQKKLSPASLVHQISGKSSYEYDNCLIVRTVPSFLM